MKIVLIKKTRNKTDAKKMIDWFLFSIPKDNNIGLKNVKLELLFSVIFSRNGIIKPIPKISNNIPTMIRKINK